MMKKTISHDRLGQVRSLVQLRKIMADAIGAHFVQLPVLDMLVELYVAHHERREVYLGSLCMVTDTSLATAYRRAMDMKKHGLVNRVSHNHDRRRICVQISSSAIATIGAMLNEIEGLCPSSHASG